MSIATLKPKFCEKAVLYVQFVRKILFENDEEKEKYKGIAQGLKKLLGYFRTYWMQRVTPEKFSVYNLAFKTDNFNESYHRNLNRKIGDKNPGPKKFLGNFIKTLLSTLFNQRIETRMLRI